MSLFNNAIIGASGQGGYRISRSVRLRSSASAYFSRTPASAGNRTTWTWSGWAKLGSGLLLYPLDAGAGTGIGVDVERIQFGTGNGLYWQRAIIQTSTTYQLQSSAVFRDPSAWYHLVLVWDSSNATSTERMRAYVNGVRLTTSAYTAPSQNQNSLVNASTPHKINTNDDTSTSYGDGYLTEVNFIDGQALTPSSFGQTNSQTGVWQPIKYAGTYGTNGFYLNFSDNSNNTATTIGKDNSGNGNNWTPNNISVTAGVTYDSMLDSPTPYADGGNGRGNYAVINPLDKSNGGNTPTMSNGNLSAAASANPTHFWSTIALPVGSTDGWYWEGICTSMDAVRTYIGMIDPTTTGASPGASYAFVDKAVLSNTGVYYNTASGTAGGSAGTFTSYAANDVVMVAYKNGKIWFGKNGTWMNSGDPAAGTGAVDASVATTKQWIPYFGYNSSWTANFGQRPFTYTPPTGFVALNTQNLPTPTISNGATVMAATTYTGTNTNLTVTNTVSGVSMKPDLVWMKARSSAFSNTLTDSVRGVSTQVFSNLTNAETTESGKGLTAFNSNGFTLGPDLVTTGSTNANGTTYVAWQWQAGQGSTSSNTSGSITSTVSVNATAGFSIVTYTGTGANATVGHGLGVAPKMIIARTRVSAVNWAVGHSSLTSWSNWLVLNLTNAQAANTNAWNGVAPTSTVFTVGTGATTNASGESHVAYCFAAVAGYSAFGSYVGTSTSDGTFVYLGFRPRWIMIKNITIGTAGQSDWVIYDTSRGTSNVVPMYLLANLSNAEATSGGNEYIDILSNGFKLRGSSNYTNSSSYTYIYAAFAENPFKISLAR